MIVVDASVVAQALTEQSDTGRRARRAIADGMDLHAPHLLDLEVANFLRRRTTVGRLSFEEAKRALEDLLLLPVRRYPHGPLLRRIWELKENVTSYDASYLALAE